MGQKVTNNARSRLVGALSAVATSFTIEAPNADLFPVANTTDWLLSVDWFKATIENSLGEIEIVHVGVRSLGSAILSNVKRGQDGTTAIAFDAGSIVGVRFTADDFQFVIDNGQNMVRTVGDQAINGSKTFLMPINGSLAGNAATADHADDATHADAADEASKVTGEIDPAVTAETKAVKTADTTVATTAFVDRLRSMHDSATTGTLVISDRGSVVPITADMTIPANVFDKGDVVTIDNISGAARSLIQGSGLTMTLVGSASAGTRTLANNGVATVMFRSPTSCVIMGGGLS